MWMRRLCFLLEEDAVFTRAVLRLCPMQIVYYWLALILYGNFEIVEYTSPLRNKYLAVRKLQN